MKKKKTKWINRRLKCNKIKSVFETHPPFEIDVKTIKWTIQQENSIAQEYIIYVKKRRNYFRMHLFETDQFVKWVRVWVCVRGLWRNRYNKCSTIRMFSIPTSIYQHIYRDLYIQSDEDQSRFEYYVYVSLFLSFIRLLFFCIISYDCYYFSF